MLLPFQAGWYHAAFAHQIKSGQHRTFHIFNRPILVFRGHSGALAATDAHCPHLGAHLGIGGKVIGDTIECPFHGWRFNQQGRCTHIPYSNKIPRKAMLRTYSIVEKNHAIYIYMSPTEETPQHELPTYTEFESPRWSRLFYHQYTTTLSEIPRTQHRLNITLEDANPGVLFARAHDDHVDCRLIHSTTPLTDHTLHVSVSFVFNKTRNVLRNALLHYSLPRDMYRITRSDILT